jgi:hypothetical protein
MGRPATLVATAGPALALGQLNRVAAARPDLAAPSLGPLDDEES